MSDTNQRDELAALIDETITPDDCGAFRMWMAKKAADAILAAGWRHVGAVDDEVERLRITLADAMKAPHTRTADELVDWVRDLYGHWAKVLLDRAQMGNRISKALALIASKEEDGVHSVVVLDNVRAALIQTGEAR